MDQFHLIIVTGMSGAGKSQAVQALEDMGYFCIDNIPPVLIPKFAELCMKGGERVRHVASSRYTGRRVFRRHEPVAERIESSGRFV